MSLTITVRANDAKTGGDNHELPADGDNGNQEIDTKSEAEAALTFLSDDKNVVVVGDKTYKREELIAIRDRKVEGEVPSPDAEAPTVQGEGASHGFGVDGYYLGGLGDNGHSGGGGRLYYQAGIPLATGNHRLFLDIKAGGDVGSFSSEYTTPGGETIDSTFTGGGLVLGAGLRYAPPILGNRLMFSFIPDFIIGGFGTADSTTVSLPTSCTPGDDSGFGRGECEPNAGNKTGNAGTTGLYNPDLGASRGTSGVMIGVDVPLAVSARVVEGDWGGLDVTAGGAFSYRHVMPDDGHGFGFPGVSGFLGIGGRFGGADAVVPSKPKIEDADGDGVEDSKDKCADTPKGTKVDAAGCEINKAADKDGDGVSDADDKCPDVAGTKENGGCPAYDAKVTTIPNAVKPEGKLPIGVKVSAKSEISIQFKDAAGKLTNAKPASVNEGESTSEFDVPAALTSGKYTLIVTMKDPKTGVEKVEEKEIVIVERITATLPGSFAPGQPPTVQDVKIVGQPKLEGVTYVIQAIDKKTGAVSGEQAIADKPGTIQDTKGSRIALQAPGGKGFQKDTDYVVTLKNKDGHVLWTGSFEIGQTPPAPKGGGGRKRL